MRGASSRRTTSQGLAAAISELVDDEAALAEARAGALRARDELTWEASAQAHLELYRELAVIFRRDRFGELVRRQLDLFVEDEAELLREAEEAEQTYDTAERELAEEAYGDYQLVLEAIADALAELRDTYAATLDGDTREAYEQAFDRAANRRFRSLTGGL